MSQRNRWLALLIGLFCLSALAGCASTPPSEFYLLTAAGEEPSGPGTASDLCVHVEPVSLPEYLNRPQLVTRDRAGGMRVVEFHRWGEPLEEAVPRVLARNLAAELRTNRVFAPRESDAARPDYRVFVNLRRLDGQPGREVALQALWTVAPLDKDLPPTVKSSRITESTASQAYEHYVAAAARALEKLSREIAAEIKRIEGR
jgi:hypothetical protein